MRLVLNSFLAFSLPPLKLAAYIGRFVVVLGGHIHTEVIGRPLYLIRKQVGPGDRGP